jgi:hypothetical protein
VLRAMMDHCKDVTDQLYDMVIGLLIVEVLVACSGLCGLLTWLLLRLHK